MLCHLISFQEWAAEYWASQGAPKDKLNVGMATYGRSFSLDRTNQNRGVNVEAEGGGLAGSYTREKGFLAYFEVHIVKCSFYSYYIYSAL